MAARLVERGVLRWESTLADVLGADAADMAAAYRSVTLEDLLAHEGGVAERLQPEQARLLPQIPDLSQRRLRAAQFALSSAPPVGAPRFRYSNLSYVIASVMMEKATGQPWETLVREHVLSPLQLSSAGIGAPDGPEAVRGHARANDGALTPLEPRDADNPTFLAPAGGLHMNMRDLALFGADHLRGVRQEGRTLLTYETYTRLHAERTDRQGLGWGGGPNGAFDNSGSNGRWLAYLRVIPAEGLVIAVAINATPPGLDETPLTELADAVSAAYSGAP